MCVRMNVCASVSFCCSVWVCLVTCRLSVAAKNCINNRYGLCFYSCAPQNVIRICNSLKMLKIKIEECFFLVWSLVFAKNKQMRTSLDGSITEILCISSTGAKQFGPDDHRLIQTDAHRSWWKRNWNTLRIFNGCKTIWSRWPQTDTNRHAPVS